MSALTTAPPRPARSAIPTRGQPRRARSRLGRYTDRETGAAREIVCVALADGSVLVIDRCADTCTDLRLVARLAPEEPSENARIVSEMYLADDTRGRCRPLTAADLGPARASAAHPDSTSPASRHVPLKDAQGRVYRIRALAAEHGSVPELRWTCSRDPGREDPFETLTLREVIARFEDYEPARTITADTLAAYRDDDRVSSCRLRVELERMAASSLVLNRGLREVVQRKIARGEFTMSQIAMRCGRIRRDCRNNLVGETSWLARRIGQLPDSGSEEPTPWVHTDVLALIVRDGLGASPNEVEL